MVIVVLSPLRFTSARASTLSGIDFVGIFGTMITASPSIVSPQHPISHTPRNDS